MSVIGLNLEKNGFRYTVLDGEKDNPSLVEKQKISINSITDISELMDWYETSFCNLLENHKPLSIGLKIGLNAKKDEIAYWYYPYGLIHNLAFKKGMKITEFVPANFTPSKFGLDKSINIYDYIDKVIGVHNPYWDKSQKYSVLSAWMVM
jgi:hypothetical protein